MSWGEHECRTTVEKKKLSDGVNTLQPTMKCDVMNDHQGVASNDAQSTCVLLYDVNVGHTGFSIELCNTLLNDGWKKHISYLDAHSFDFSLWRKQSDLQFGFVPTWSYQTMLVILVTRSMTPFKSTSGSSLLVSQTFWGQESPLGLN